MNPVDEKFMLSQIQWIISEYLADPLDPADEKFDIYLIADPADDTRISGGSGGSGG